MRTSSWIPNCTLVMVKLHIFLSKPDWSFQRLNSVLKGTFAPCQKSSITLLFSYFCLIWSQGTRKFYLLTLINGFIFRCSSYCKPLGSRFRTIDRFLTYFLMWPFPSNHCLCSSWFSGLTACWLFWADLFDWLKGINVSWSMALWVMIKTFLSII